MLYEVITYRDEGVASQCAAIIERVCHEKGYPCETLVLKNFELHFCTNCRSCMQQEGHDAGVCIHDDAMAGILEKIETARAFVLLSPTNMGSVTALFKCFAERLSPLAYWPWGANAPKFRRESEEKRALLITSTAMPSLMARFLTSSMNVMTMAAASMGAKKVKKLYLGLVASRQNYQLDASERQRIEKAAARLISQTAG